MLFSITAIYSSWYFFPIWISSWREFAERTISFSLSGRITAFAGPLMVGTLTYIYSQRIGFLSITIFFIIGFIMMLSVKNV